MVRAPSLDDGQVLETLNEVYVGHPTHQSARYRRSPGDDGHWERQSSSARRVDRARRDRLGGVDPHDRGAPVAPPRPTDPALAWFVREAWPLAVDGVSLHRRAPRRFRCCTSWSSRTVVPFGDGQETDRLTATWARRVTLGLAARTLTLVA